MSKIDLYTVGKYGIHERARFKRTMRFVGDGLFDGPERRTMPDAASAFGRTLEVGESNEFGRWTKDYFSIEMENTSGDLNGQQWKPYAGSFFDTIFVFEVIEHLFNPLKLLDELSLRCRRDTRVFITYPAGTWISWWMRMHFHEIGRERFKLLLEHSPFREVRYERVFLWGDWKYWLFRVRPFLRYVVFGLRYQYYELRLK